VESTRLTKQAAEGYLGRRSYRTCQNKSNSESRNPSTVYKYVTKRSIESKTIATRDVEARDSTADRCRIFILHAGNLRKVSVKHTYRLNMRILPISTTREFISPKPLIDPAILCYGARVRILVRAFMSSGRAVVSQQCHAMELLWAGCKVDFTKIAKKED